MNQEQKRLFFGAEVAAPWPPEYPEGRLIDENFRHITLAFLGQTNFVKLQPLISSIPLPPFAIGPTAKCDGLAFLPEKTPRVVVGNIQWLEQKDQINAYQHALSAFLTLHGFPLDGRPFYPHITVARAPFLEEQWLEAFVEFPFFLKAIHLYQSMGNLHYEKIWTHPLIAPFEEVEHTADIAFTIHGETLEQIHLHAEMALCFKYPALLGFLSDKPESDLDEIIIALNAMIARADEQIGVPFKAVSFHGEIKQQLSFLQWEMIVDV